MHRFLPAQLTAIIMFIFLILNTLFCAAQLFPLALLKFIIPIKWWRKITGKILVRVANNWVFLNSFVIHHTFPIEWNIQGTEKLKKNDWYLVISNHQSWVDIVILQKVLYGRIPYIKFFLKKELIRVPIMGLAWWALDFPFMKRYTKEEVEKNPSLKGKDIEITRKACEKFKTDYVTVMTFPEGTRFTREKHNSQQSPYKHLLKPKAGGLSFTISAMGDKIHKLLNMTIVYPEGSGTMWDFLCGRIRKVDVFVETMLIPEKFINVDLDNERFQSEFKDWLNGLWKIKDELIESHLDKK